MDQNPQKDSCKLVTYGDIVTWRDYVDARFLALQKTFDAGFDSHRKIDDVRFDAIEKAFEKADKASDIKFATVNEWRRTYADLVETMLPKTEYNLAHQLLIDRINDLTTRMNAKESESQGKGEVWSYIIGGLGFVSLIISIAYYISVIHHS